MRPSYQLALALATILMSGLVAYGTVRYTLTGAIAGAPGATTDRTGTPPLETFQFSEDFRLRTADAAFLKLSLALAYRDEPKLSIELSARRLEIRDRIYFLLMAKTKKELNGVENLRKLKREIKDDINAVLNDGRIETVYFRELIVWVPPRR